MFWELIVITVLFPLLAGSYLVLALTRPKLPLWGKLQEYRKLEMEYRSLVRRDDS